MELFTDCVLPVTDGMTKELDPRYPLSFIATKEGTRVLTIHIPSEIVAPAFYIDACMWAVSMGPDDRIDIILNTNGGQVVTAAMLSHALLQSAAPVRALAFGKVISAGTLLLPDCNEIEISDDAVFMFHGASGGVMGKMATIAEFSSAMMSYISHQFNRMADLGILLPEEVVEIVSNSSDVYIPGRVIKQRLEDRSNG